MTSYTYETGPSQNAEIRLFAAGGIDLDLHSLRVSLGSRDHCHAQEGIPADHSAGRILLRDRRRRRRRYEKDGAELFAEVDGRRYVRRLVPHHPPPPKRLSGRQATAGL